MQHAIDHYIRFKPDEVKQALVNWAVEHGTVVPAYAHISAVSGCCDVTISWKEQPKKEGGGD